MACGSGTLLIDDPDAPVQTGRVLEAVCNRWNCPECGPRKTRAIRARLNAALEEVREQEVCWLAQQGQNPSRAWRVFKFFTFTTDIKHFINPERYRTHDWTATPDESAEAHRHMMRAWNKMHAWLTWRRRHTVRGPRAPWEGSGVTVKYFGVLEFTRNGWPHLHIVVLWRERLSRADIATIRRLWDKYGIGQSVAIRNKTRTFREPRRIASYLSKYLAKTLSTIVPGVNLRRRFSSRKFLPKLDRQRREGEAGWSSESVARHRAERRGAGARITDVPHGFHWELDGVLSPLDPLTRDVWQALTDVGAAPAPPEQTYRSAGPDLQTRLRLPPKRSAIMPDGTPLLIADHIAQGIQGRRGRRPAGRMPAAG